MHVDRDFSHDPCLFVLVMEKQTTIFGAIFCLKRRYKCDLTEQKAK